LTSLSLFAIFVFTGVPHAVGLLNKLNLLQRRNKTLLQHRKQNQVTDYIW